MRHLPLLLLAGLFASCASNVGNEKELASFSAASLPPDVRLSLAHESWVQAVSLDLQGQPQLALELMQATAFYDPSDRWLQITLARRLRDFRRSAQALSILRRALKMEGEESPGDWELAAGLYLEQGQKDSAELCWNRVLQLDPHSREALLGQGSLAEASGKSAEAASRFGRLSLEYGPNATSLAERAGGLWLRAGEPDSACGLFRTRWDEWHAPADGESLARLLLATGKPDDAVDLYDSLVEMSPEESPRLELMAARALLQGGHRDDALSRLREMQDDSPDDPKVLGSLGAILMDVDSLASARMVFEQMRKAQPASALPGYFLGVLHLRKHETDSARTEFDKSLALDSSAIDTWIRRGMLELETDSAGRATEVFQKMVKVWPKLPQSRFLLGYALSHQAHSRLRHPQREWSPPDSEPEATALRRRALTEFDTALSIDTGLQRARFERGALRERLGLWEAARADLEGAVRQNPEDANTANYLGYLYADRGESLDRADSLISSALRTDPDNTAFLDSRAWLRFHQGRQVEALKDIESALASGESDLTIRVHKARILEALGRKTDARTIWVAIAKIDPAHPEAKAGLERTK